MSRNTTRASVSALAVGLGLLGATEAQAITVDTTFGTGGTLATPLSASLSDRNLAAAPAPGGGVYVAGYTSPVIAGDRAFSVTKITAAGAIDTSFGTAGTAVVNVSPAPFDAPPAGGTAPGGTAEQARAIAVQPDGKIVVGGFAETLTGADDSRDTDGFVVRLLPSGAPDTGFGTAGIAQVNPTDGRNTALPDGATAPTGDQAWGMVLRPERQDRPCARPRPGLVGAHPHQARDRRRAAQR